MSNAVAALYAYRAREARSTAATFRRFGYHASAAVLERRAERYDEQAERESKKAPSNYAGGLSVPSSNHGDSLDSDLHMPSYGNEQSGLFFQQEPPA